MSEDQQVTSTEGAFRFLADFCAPTEAICTHDQNVVIGAPIGDAWDDHELAPVFCIGCKGVFMATIWRIDRETDFREMTPSQRARYVPMTTAEVGRSWSAA
ncbi:MAG: hypothetical protein JWL61_5018 [Gemmatimonadetes bacterium]|nr:hypothetical protein [Gemmatimonadota bacterium]